MPKKNRSKGEGTIFQRKDGRWQAAYFDNAGKRRTLYGKTEKEALTKMKNAIRDSDDGMAMDKNKILFVDWIREWLEVYCKPTVRPNTYAWRYRHLNDYVIPAFPKTLLKDLRPDMLQKFFNRLAVDGSIKKTDEPSGLGQQTIKGIKILLVGVLKQAVENGIILNNPAQKAKLPPVEKKEIRILSIDEQKRLEAVLLESERPIYFAIYLTLYTGMRCGEVTGLRVSDVDLDRGEIHIRRSIGRTKIPETGKTELIIGNAKTTKGERIIPLPSFIGSVRKLLNEKRYDIHATENIFRS